MAARHSFQGEAVFNIGGPSISVKQVIDAIEEVEPVMQGKISFVDNPLPFPPDVDNQVLVEFLGQLPETPLIEGVSETIQLYKSAIANGLVKPSDVKEILA